MADLPPFKDVLTAVSARGDMDDDQLADVIESDGDARIAAGQPVCLQEYLDAVPNLGERSDPLDAAIEVILRFRSDSSRITSDAVESLIAEFPQFEANIAESAELTNCIWSTDALNKKLADAPQRSLPSDFGPLYEAGQSRYELVESLGTGASGDVYKAIDRKLCEPDLPVYVAIKILPPTDDPSQQHLAREEAVKARQINDSNVVGVLDYGMTDLGERYIVHVYVAGGDLQKWVDQHHSTKDIRTAVQLVEQVSRGVQAAHEVGLIHCDLKPSNIMLTEDYHPMVADFGIAIRTKDGKRHSTATSDQVPIGNLAFISPEQFHLAGDMPLTVRSDVYSIGGMLYYLLTDKLPHGDTPAEVARAHERPLGSRIAPSPRSVDKSIDQDLDAICRKALAPEPGLRYRSAGALADDLHKWLTHRPIDWQKPSVLHRAKLLAIRQPFAMIAAGVLLAVSVAGGFFAYRAIQESARRQAMIENARAMAGQLAVVNKDLPPTSRLPRMAWVLRHVLETEMLGSPIDTRDIHVANMHNLEKFLEQRATHGKPLGLFEQVCKYTLAFWMLGEERWADSSQLLSELQEFADLRLPDDVVFHDDIAAMQAIATVQMALEKSALSPEQSQLRSLTAEQKLLHRVAASRGQSDPGSPLHLLLLETLRELYGQSNLGNAESFQDVENAIEDATARRLLFGN